MDKMTEPVATHIKHFVVFLSICVSVHSSVHMYVCLSVYPMICLRHLTQFFLLYFSL